MPFNIDWRSIDDVLLDMDGTLLDLHYDATWLNNVHSIVANLTGEPEHVIQERFHRELKSMKAPWLGIAPITGLIFLGLI